MIRYWKSVRQAKAARRRYELARIEGLLSDLERVRIQRQRPAECSQCVALGPLDHPLPA